MLKNGHLVCIIEEFSLSLTEMGIFYPTFQRFVLAVF